MTNTNDPSSTSSNTIEDKELDDYLECAICLNQCMQPVQLPCTHIFCFLCAKGIALQSKKCALCRSTIPQSFLLKPNLFAKKLDENESEEGESQTEDCYTWFYQGKQGWWKYDERTSEEIENAYINKLDSLDVLIAGAVYIIDLKNKIQYQKNRNWRRREIKRDIVTASRKGIAGMHDSGKGDNDTSADGQSTMNTDNGAGTSSTQTISTGQTAVQIALGRISSQHLDNSNQVASSSSTSSTVSNNIPLPLLTTRNVPLGGTDASSSSTSLPHSPPAHHHHSYNTRSSS